MNPWLLAALVFGAIGLIVEGVQRKDDKTEAQIAADKKLAATKKAAKKKAKPKVTETHPQPSVVVQLPGETVVKKPTAEVPTITPTED